MLLVRTFSIGCFILLVVSTQASADDWPQWRGSARDGVWSETGLIESFAAPQIEVTWRQPIGSGYSGPTVAAGRVYVTDRIVEPEQIERIHCFDAKTGKPLWQHSYPSAYEIGYQAGPRASVTIDKGAAYAIGAMGHFHCLNAATGEVVWERDLNQDFKIAETKRMPIWGIAAAPLVFEDLVIAHIGATDGASIVAFDKKTGVTVWKSLDDRAQYSAPILIQQAGKPVFVCWTGDSVAGLAPETGEVYWRHPLKPRNMPIGIATPVVDKDRLFVTSFYDGSLLLKLRQDKPAVDEIWRRIGRNEKNTDALHSIISTPLFRGQYIYGVDSYGELRCLEAASGERIWEDTTATPRNRWSNIHFVRNGETIWMFNEQGELIIANLSPQGFREISRAKLIQPTTAQLSGSGRRQGVCWAHPAFANKHVFIRNDNEILCSSLAAE